MIISHKHKYIFFKTRKTAGTSLQIALSEFCGDDDIITGSHKFYGEETEKHFSGINMDKFWTDHPHPTLKETKMFLGEDIWNSYFKFAFVRNPYEIAVSRYYWERRGKLKIDDCSIDNFRMWVKNELVNKSFDLMYPYIVDNGLIDLDFIGRYETLQDDVDYLSKIINLPEIKLGQNKSGYRDKLHYSKHYDEESKNMVSNFFEKDLNMFNYSFENDKSITKLLPIITSDMLKNNDGDNINGPSLIEVPDWIENKLGKYYLYFANHDGRYIRLAYSDNIEYGWKVYEPGTLKLEETPCENHIASPDVHIDEKNKRIVMYYHGVINDKKAPNSQCSFVAFSENGIDFKSSNDILGMFYFRVFEYKNKFYALAKNKNTDCVVYESADGIKNFTPIFYLIPNMRHSAVNLNDDILEIYYSIVGDLQEKIYLCKLKLDIDIDNWEVISNEIFTSPEFKWEGSHLPLLNSNLGTAFNPVNQLRDPYLFDGKDNQFLLYSIAGEKGIGILRIKEGKICIN